MTWYLKLVKEHAKPIIIRSKTFLMWNGISYKPGTYKILKGTKITAKITVKNTGVKGWVKTALFDEIGRVYIKEWMEVLDKGQTETYTVKFEANRNFAIRILTFYWNGKWILVDEYG